MGFESMRGGPRTPERSFTRETLRRNSAELLASKGMNWQDIVQAGQNIEIDLIFNPSSERGVPDLLKKFIQAKYGGQKSMAQVGLSSIKVCFEYMSAPGHPGGYLNQIQLEAYRKGEAGALQDMTSLGIIIPQEDMIRSRTITLLPDLETPRWAMTKTPITAAINPHLGIKETPVGGNLDDRILIDVASLIPDSEPVQQEIRRPLSSASGLVRLGYNTVRKGWNPEPAGPIAPPHKLVTIQDPQYR